MTSYYRSFSAESYPVQPIGPIVFSQAMDLVTYYSAKYDTEHRLIEFIKHVRSDANWTIAFEEHYEYWKSGKLRKRELRIPDKTAQIWEFGDNEVPWTRYLNQLCSRWFGAKETEGFNLRESVLLLHEQITELELEIFSSSVQSTRNAEWAYRTTMGAMVNMKRVFEHVAPSSVPKLHALAEGEASVLNLSGFDEPQPNLFGIVQEWLERNGFVTPFEVVTISPKEDFDPESQVWAQNANIGSITVGEVMANHDGGLTPAFNLYLTLTAPLTNEQATIVNSLFRRTIVIIERVADMARSYESYRALSDED